ncbi:flagellar biosynthesis protein FlhF [Metabacillus sediminilitoris]|uniref:Flagellar biosynthesis protein FlhF n=1 Tax=Metabacillus sediminilitoris TaxID=2567941 RepID=A0A4S4C598_9BACI|nr:flagellar biosynthesis protein FlhF [Metabacillus sediminilitoris]QGQ46839.1 flagellar biosynthesis protein FlhF [Metabacillus sediminilitoris]THF82987.1 flagellar biosynthesis protein FlhF [Metabacillus sediminilitoris]
MKVKKYVAPSMQEAMKKIRSEMGNDAVILNSKVVHTGGFLGLFSQKKIEVIAALDPEIPLPKKRKEKESNLKTNNPILSKEEITQNERIKPVKAIEDHQHLLEEIKELKGILQSISANEKSDLYPEPLKVILQVMIRQEINPAIRGQIMTDLLEYWFQAGGNITSTQLKNKELELFVQLLNDLDFGGISYEKKYINVVGPTGVGKTTTLAKLAAKCVLEKKKKVAFITTDTYRIAAIDQLKTYAKILNVPIEVCYNIDDFKEAKKKFERYDYLFIDTAGRNFLDSQYVKDLKLIIDFNDELESYLVLAATAKPSDMLAVYEQFSVIPIKKLIFTKLDETTSRGSLIDVMIKTKKGIAYTTHGQNVPDDIEEATTEHIVEQILR